MGLYYNDKNGLKGEKSMFDFKNKKSRICFWGMLICLVITLIVFYATDGWLGDKEFSEYTREDWAIAIIPLAIIVLSGVASIVFAFIILIPMIFMYPALMKYVTNRKFSEVEEGTEFFVFDHNEFKRACCRKENQNGIWFSVKEYNLKAKNWTMLEEGRYIENGNDLLRVLQEDYKYDQVKIYDTQKNRIR